MRACLNSILWVHKNSLWIGVVDSCLQCGPLSIPEWGIINPDHHKELLSLGPAKVHVFGMMRLAKATTKAVTATTYPYVT